MNVIFFTGEPEVFSFASIHDSNMVLQKAPQRANVRGYAEVVYTIFWTNQNWKLRKELFWIEILKQLLFLSFLTVFQVDQEVILEFNDIFYEVTTALGT